MNSINRDISFTAESQEDFPDLHIPTLDTKLRLLYHPDGTANRITYTFYEKDINTQYATLETTAQSQNDKVQALSKKIERRLFRTDNSRPQTEVNSILDKYTEKLTRSGYCISQIRQIVTSGIRCYLRKVKEQEENKPKKMSCPKSRFKRILKKHTDKTLWYKINPSKSTATDDNKKV